jgi:acyl-CoA hydrolase
VLGNAKIFHLDIRSHLKCTRWRLRNGKDTLDALQPSKTSFFDPLAGLRDLHIWPRLPKLELDAPKSEPDIGTRSAPRAANSILLGVCLADSACPIAGQRSKRKMSCIEMNPAARTIASTQSEMTEIILPNDTNTLGNLLGGRLMHFIDLTGAMAAYRHSRTNVVTAAMDHIDFIRPVHLGDLLTLRSSVNRAFSTSMEVGVKVWAENTRTGCIVHVASAYLVFVAIDDEGRRVRIPEAVPETPAELRRYEGAMRRRENREAETNRRKQAKLATRAEEDTALQP